MEQQEHKAPGGHYSGTNRIPNIKQFMEGLDKEKRERDAKIDAQLKQNKSAGGEVKAHHDDQPKGNNRRTVRDPVTGKDVEIDDIGPEMMKAVEDPHVSPIDILLIGLELTLCSALRSQRQSRQGHHRQDRSYPVWRGVPAQPGHYSTARPGGARNDERCAHPRGEDQRALPPDPVREL